jgi:hypothetical protein
LERGGAVEGDDMASGGERREEKEEEERENERHDHMIVSKILVFFWFLLRRLGQYTRSSLFCGSKCSAKIILGAIIVVNFQFFIYYNRTEVYFNA